MASPNTVFVLGAGASVEAGVPTMARFLERAFLLSPSTEAKPAFDLVARGRSLLQQSQSKAQLNIRNLESVFAAFEMAALFGRLGNLPAPDIERLVPSMQTLIVQTIQHCMEVEFFQGRMAAPSKYADFGKLLKQLREKGHNVSVITFNYDIGIDLGLWHNQVDTDYCLADRNDPNNASIELMKLHGSVNWAGCPKCSRIIPRYMRVAVPQLQTKVSEFGVPTKQMSLSALAYAEKFLEAKCGACGTACKPEPVIIPPTPNKARLHTELKSVWQRAAAKLSEAENIFVIGYSWPEGDHFFHQLYAVGSVGPTILSRFWVWDPDENVKLKFKSRLLGQQALDCFGPPHEGTKFSHALQRLPGEFGITK
jgi:NAD-dependent SIR2 family protein deacetylase